MVCRAATDAGNATAQAEEEEKEEAAAVEAEGNRPTVEVVPPRLWAGARAEGVIVIIVVTTVKGACCG